MQTIKLLLLGFFIIMAAGCSDQEHSHNDNSHEHTPTKHDTIN